MIYRFVILSDEIDNFGREISIDSDSTFEDLQNVILDSVNYKKGEMTSFFLCADNWEKGTEITMMDMGTDSSEDSWIMSDTTISELIEDEGQKLVFVFDYLTERCFFMELEEVVSGSLEKAYCSKSKGDAPAQFVEFENFEKETKFEADEDFYGAEDFDMDELDAEGFEFGEGDPYDDKF
ncbi:MAG: IS1096 element passenger TnpR family protein [Bacteroidales bacterium]